MGFQSVRSPTFAGINKAMIKSAKKAMYIVLGTSDVTDEELITAIAGVESLLNSRPLTYWSANPQTASSLEYLIFRITAEFLALESSSYHDKDSLMQLTQ